MGIGVSIEADKDIVESYFILPDDEMEDPDRQSKWLLRIVLGRRKLLDKGLTVSDVAASIKAEYDRNIAVIFSDNNADEQVIRTNVFHFSQVDNSAWHHIMRFYWRLPSVCTRCMAAVGPARGVLNCREPKNGGADAGTNRIPASVQRVSAPPYRRSIDYHASFTEGPKGDMRKPPTKRPR